MAQVNPALAFTAAFVSSIVLADIPMDAPGSPRPVPMGLWGPDTYRRVDQAISICKSVFRAQQEYLQRLIQANGDANKKLEAMTALQGLTKDMAELTMLKARLRMWEIVDYDQPA